MLKDMLVSTVKLGKINSDIQTAAEDSVMPEVKPLPERLLKGTDITERLNTDMGELYKLMDLHHTHTAEVLPTMFGKIKASYIVVDKAVSDSFRMEE